MMFMLKLYAAIRRDLIVLALCPSLWNMCPPRTKEGEPFGIDVKEGVRRLFEVADAIEARLAQERMDWGR